jgi:hypothetical protein
MRWHWVCFLQLLSLLASRVPIHRGLSHVDRSLT